MFHNTLRSTSGRFRFSHQKRAARKARAAMMRASFAEALESRQLLTTVTGGGPGRTTEFEFLDARSNDIRVALRGNIVVELIGYDATRNRLLDMNTNIASTTPGYDLFEIYIAQADLNSSMSIAIVPKPPATSRPMQPFASNFAGLSITNATTGLSETVSAAAASGGAFLGARTSEEAMPPNVPIFNAKWGSAFGVMPEVPNHKIVAGIVTAPGVSVGQVLFGGTITGRVDIEGSCNLFYAGQIWTGDANGLYRQEAPTFRQNFYIGGDLRNLVTQGPIGSGGLTGDNVEEMQYKTGFDMKVKGRLGQVFTRSDFLGAVTVINDPAFLGPGGMIPEVETRTAPFPQPSDRTNFEGDFMFGRDERHRAPSLGDTAAFTNDTIATAQLVGTARSSNNSGNIVAEIAGQLDGSVNVEDNVDYYQMALLAGQNVQVQLTPQDAFASMHVAVFDSDNRMVASDYSNENDSTTRNLPFRFTADRPGVFKFAVAWSNDTNFSGALDGDETSAPAKSSLTNYTLLLTRAADIAFGGILAHGSILNTDELDPNSFDEAPSASFDVEQGDLGALLTVGNAGTGAGSSIFIGGSSVGNIARPITVKHGNLRVLDSDSIGVVRNGEPVGGPNLLVPRGGVGLLRSRGTDATSQMLTVNMSYVVPFAGTFNPKNAIGFDYQVVDSATIFSGNLLADRGIGIIRADSYSTVGTAPRLAVNADNRGNDGFIDLIDCRTEFGTITAGGPEITTGNSGNVRYIHVANPAAVFRDRFFGGGTNEETELNPGQPFRYTDDSGASVKLSTTPAQPITADPFLSGTMIVETYGIRDKGGSVLVNVDVLSTESVDAAGAPITLGHGLQVDSGSAAGVGSVEIGNINLFTPGTNFLFDPLTRSFTRTGVDATTAGQPSDILLKGSLPINVFDMSAHEPDGTTLAGFTSIDNRTTGELVNIEAGSIGLLQGQNIGVAMSKTKASLQGLGPDVGTFRTNAAPFSQQNTLIRVDGDIQTIRARGAVGNIFVGPNSNGTGLRGNIGELSANTDGRHTDPNLVEGIDAPILVNRSIASVNIGEQLTSSGSGDFEQSGLFVGGAIGTITNQGTGSDIRGDIIALAIPTTLGTGVPLPAVSIKDSTGFIRQTLPAATGVGQITLNNGAIIDADILVTRILTDGLELPRFLTYAGSYSPFFPATLNNIDSITINGIGGIIGSLIGADTIGNINIRGGFGVIDSNINQPGNSTFQGIDTDGYGVRRTTIEGGATLDHITARGQGKLLNTLTYTPSVRMSETQQFDPSSGRLLTETNDLHKFLGTSRANPKNSDESLAGTIEDTTLSGSRDLNLVQAYRIFGRTNEIDPLTLRPMMRISFAENVGKILIYQDTDGLDMTAGTVKLMSTGRNFLNDTISVNNVLSSIIAGGNIKASATIEAVSGEGRIDAITTGLALNGTITAARRIGTITVGSNLGSHSVSSSRDIILVHVNGSIQNLATVRAANTINQLIVGHNIDTGGTVRAKRILSQTVLGQVRGDIIVG